MNRTLRVGLEKDLPPPTEPPHDAGASQTLELPLDRALTDTGRSDDLTEIEGLLRTAEEKG
ncbi:MAG: hypothetical protein AB1486_12495 [Planctomycetota bacterium]